MPAVPKKRCASARQGERRSHLALTVNEIAECSHCHQPTRHHHVCPTCGWYGGRLVVERKLKKERSE